MKHLQEIIDLIEITGDKCIFPSASGEQFIVMRLDDYKRLLRNIPNFKQFSLEELTAKLGQELEQYNLRKPSYDGVKARKWLTNIKEFEIKQRILAEKETDEYLTEPNSL